MAKLFDKISADFMAAIKGVVESTAAYEKARDEEKKARMSGEDKDKIAKLAAMMSKEKKLKKEEVDPDLEDELKKTRQTKKSVEDAKKKYAKEEAEQIDELSTKKLTDYTAKASDARGHKNLSTAKLDKRNKAMAVAHEKIRARHVKVPANEEVEQVDELSRATVGRYSMKAKSIADNEGGKDRSKGRELAGRKRWGGTMKGVDKARVPATEEVQIDELSKETMGRYIKKAATRIGTQGVTAGLKIAKDEKSQKNFDTIGKRERGISTAVKKLTKEEIEMIEAKLAGVADGALEGDKHMCATKVFHKEWNEGTPIKTMHADPDENGLIEWYDVMFDHGIERVMTEDMEVLQAESHMHSKRGMKKEDVDQAEPVVEARGRPKKAAAKDFTVHPITKEKLMHNNPEHMKKIEKLQKHGVLDKPKTEAGQHIINQLRKASTSMQGGSTVHFTHGESKHVSAAHASKALDKYAGMKPSEKESFQKKISHSHEEMMKHI